MFDLITIGHFAIDFIVLPGERKPRKRLGGPPTYTSLAARRLGLSVSVISKVGGDFPSRYIEWLRRRGVDLSGLKVDKDAQTTSFLIKYHPADERDMILKSRAPPILIEDLLDSLKAKAVHISPIANEIAIDLIAEAKRLAPIISLDPQGLLRCFDEDGKMSLRGIKDLDFLRYVEVFKSSKEEVRVLTGEHDVAEAIKKIRGYGVKIVMATMGKEGTLISFDNEFFRIPIAESKIVADSTGAGDVFIGAFLAGYVKNEDPLWCACLGAAASSFVIEKIGPNGFKGMKKVYRRAKQIYEKLYR